MGISEISKPSIYGKIEKLKKNCEKVPIELLRTKYRKPYMELLEGIRDDLTMIIYTTCFTFPLAVGSSEEEKKELMEGSRKLIREIAADGVMNEVRDAVFKNYDMDGAFLIIAKKICFRSWYEVFAPYWIRHCRMDPDGRIRNDIIGDDYSYSFDSGVWISEKSGSATMLLPPTMDLIEKERREENMSSCITCVHEESCNQSEPGNFCVRYRPDYDEAQRLKKLEKEDSDGGGEENQTALL